MEDGVKLLLAALLTFLAPIASADPSWWFFSRNPQYYDPLIAGVRDAQLSALVPAFYDRMPMMVKRDAKRIGWDIDIGSEIPILGRDSADSTDRRGHPAPGRWGAGFWIPIDF